MSTSGKCIVKVTLAAEGAHWEELYELSPIPDMKVLSQRMQMGQVIMIVIAIEIVEIE